MHNKVKFNFERRIRRLVIFYFVGFSLKKTLNGQVGIVNARLMTDVT